VAKKWGKTVSRKRRQAVAPGGGTRGADTKSASVFSPSAVLCVPTFARSGDLTGAWAIEPRAASAKWETLRKRADLKEHVQQEPPPLRSAMEKQPGRSGKMVAVIKLTGTLMKQQSSLGDGTSTVQARRDIRQASADPDVSAILLAIDSPGGSVAGTDDLAADIRTARKSKPVYAQIEDLGASAAYWLASQAEKVYANSPTALVGCIGTIITMWDSSAKAELKGMKSLVFATGPLKGAGVDGTPITEDQAAYFQGIVDKSQTSFSSAVQKGRGLTDKQLADVSSGGVFSADEALDKKLIDGIQPLETTLAQLASAGWKAQTSTTKRGAVAPAHRKGITMEFKEWLVAQGFIETLSETQLANMRAIYDALPDADAAPPVAPDAALAAVEQMRQEWAVETQRVADIRRVCAENGNPSIKVDGKLLAVEAHAIAKGWTAEQAQTTAALEHLRAQRASGPTLISRGHDQDCSLEALQGAVLLRSNCRLDNPLFQRPEAIGMGIPKWLRAGLNTDQRQRAMETSHRFADMSLVDLCREALRVGGQDVPGNRGDMIRAAFSGGTLTSIFTTNVNTIILSKYLESPDTTAGWTQATDVADFKKNERPRMSKASGLAKLPRGGNADHLSRADAGESYNIARYAKQFVVDEQDIIDDAFNALNDTPNEMGMAASRLRPDLVYSILLANATLATTGVALFSASNPASNLKTASALASPTLKAAISEMRLFQENGVNLGLEPTHFVGPPTLGFTARELMNSTNIVIARGGTTDTSLERGNANVLQSLLQVVTDPRLENGVTDPSSGTAYGGSSTTWFIACGTAHTIEVGYLRGTGRAPQVRSFILTQGQWGLGWDVNLDIGAKAMDWRGMVQNNA
jgi:signal peptide peptidase SppA